MRPPRPDFVFSRLNDGEMPLSEMDRFEESISRPTDEQGGDAGDDVASPGNGASLTPPAQLGLWGQITGLYTAEGGSLSLYNFSEILHDDNVAVVPEGAFQGVALEVNDNASVPTGTVCQFYPSEDSLAGAEGEKWRFCYPASTGGGGGATGPPSYVSTIGDGSSTVFTLTHGFTTSALLTQIQDTSSSSQLIYPVVDYPSSTTVRIDFGTYVPASNQFRVLVLTTAAVPPGGVAGPPSSTPGAIATWSGTTGTALLNTTVLVGSSGALTGVPSLTGTGGALALSGGTAATDTLSLSGPAGIGFSVTSGGTPTTALSLTRPGVLTVPTLTTAPPTPASGSASIYVDNTGALHVIDQAGVNRPAGTVTSITAGAGLSGGTISSVGTVALDSPVSVANGGTGTATPSLVAGSNVTVTGSWPNQTVSASGGAAARTEGTLAAAGSTQGTAALITTDAVDVTGADGTKGVILPQKAAAVVAVWNDVGGPNSLKVYPPVGASIGSTTPNAADTIGGNAAKVYYRISATRWQAQLTQT